MVSEDLCLDCFQEMPHEEEEIICSDYSDSIRCEEADASLE